MYRITGHYHGLTLVTGEAEGLPGSALPETESWGTTGRGTTTTCPVFPAGNRNRAQSCGPEQLLLSRPGLLVRHDVEQDDGGRPCQGDRFRAPCECPDWCVEPEKAQRSCCLAVP